MAYYVSLMLVQTKLVSPANSPKKEIYRGEQVEIRDLIEKLGIDISNDSLDRNKFFIISKARLVGEDYEQVEVTRDVYTLSELEKGKADPQRHKCELKARFPLNEKSIESFLNIEIPKYPKP